MKWVFGGLFLAGLIPLGCINPPCEVLPTSFQLNVEIDNDDDPSPIVFLDVEITAGPDRWQRRFEVFDTLEDRLTSLAVEIQPEPMDVDEVIIRVDAYGEAGTDGPLLFTKTNDFGLSADGCNDWFMELDQTDG